MAWQAFLREFVKIVNAGFVRIVSIVHVLVLVTSEILLTTALVWPAISNKWKAPLHVNFPTV